MKHEICDFSLGPSPRACHYAYGKKNISMSENVANLKCFWPQASERVCVNAHMVDMKTVGIKVRQTL